MKENYKKFLEKDAYEVHEAPNGQDAMKKLDEVQPDLVILDIIMPGMTGLEVCEKMRQKPEFAKTPVIVVSSLDKTAIEEDALQVGANEYFQKPFSTKAIREMVKKYLGD